MAAVTTDRKPEKVAPPSPPLIIRDRANDGVYKRVGFLGEGGFARVYEITDSEGQRKAIKTIAKSSIKTKKAKTKLWAEIKLHQMLDHPNIVKFEDCFEDDEFVYMVLELCENGSLMDLLKRRKRYSEPEVRHILVQLIGACQYMHQTNVIHRDLKLGNLFLDQNMNVKVGDLGLAALIEKPGDRKKTICGTPNYIAPEVLFDQANGHSFEVDIWSIGVILYTLLIGRPPFQTKDVKAIYKRIRENRYEFPGDKPISPSAEELIMSILNPDPNERPSLDFIVKHRFFQETPFPPFIPIIALDGIPDFRKITDSQSKRYFESAVYKARIGATAGITVENVRVKAGLGNAALGPSIVKQEQDFRNAVQPDSPISALLTSARQPLVQAPTQIKEPSLLRKLSAVNAQATLSPVRRPPFGKENANAGPSSAGRRPLGRLAEDAEEDDSPEETAQDQHRRGGYEAGVRERALEKQKARIVSEMAPQNLQGQQEPQRTDRYPRETSPRKPLGHATTVAGNHVDRYQDLKPREAGKSRTRGLFETCGRTLLYALSAAKTSEGFVSTIPPGPPPPRPFVVSWLDYCQKYGMGFAMSDGTIAVHFNDSSSIVLSPNKLYFDYIRPTGSGAGETLQGNRMNYTLKEYPKDLGNKVYLLQHFEKYMIERLVKGGQAFTYVDEKTTRGMVFVTRYLRMKHVIVFRLSNDIIQFNFYDHVKLILSNDAFVITVIDKYQEMTTYSLEELLAPRSEDIHPREKRKLDTILHKLEYARDVLYKIKTHAPAKKQEEAGLEVQVAPTREVVRPIR